MSVNLTLHFSDRQNLKSKDPEELLQIYNHKIWPRGCLHNEDLPGTFVTNCKQQCIFHDTTFRCTSKYTVCYNTPPTELQYSSKVHVHVNVRNMVLKHLDQKELAF